VDKEHGFSSSKNKKANETSAFDYLQYKQTKAAFIMVQYAKTNTIQSTSKQLEQIRKMEIDNAQKMGSNDMSAFSYL
jgi:formylmethanofuran dehydrogenase subunit B